MGGRKVKETREESKNKKKYDAICTKKNNIFEFQRRYFDERPRRKLLSVSEHLFLSVYVFGCGFLLGLLVVTVGQGCWLWLIAWVVGCDCWLQLFAVDVIVNVA